MQEQQSVNTAKRGMRAEVYRMLDSGATEETIRSAFPSANPVTLRSYLYAYNHSHGIVKARQGMRAQVYRMLDGGATEEEVRAAFPSANPVTLRSYLYAYKHRVGKPDAQ